MSATATATATAGGGDFVLQTATLVQHWLAELSEVRPIFHSEADFQFALSRVMADSGVERVRLERRVRLGEDRIMQPDITGYLDGQPFVLELKYPKEKFVGTVRTEGHDEDFNLSTGEPGLIYIWKDVERIEALLRSGLVVAGAAITLTNFKLWLENKRPNQLSEFQLFDGRALDANAPLELPVGTTWAPDGIKIELASPYRCEWHPYSTLEGTEFRYLILEPTAF